MIQIEIGVEELRDLIKSVVSEELDACIKEFQSSSKEPPLSLQELASFLGKSRQTIYSWLKKGYLTGYRVSGSLVFDKEEVLKSLKQKNVNL